MSAVCPACGVPVMPGYVKCPKCHAALPYGSGRRGIAVGAGGTAVEERGFPILAVAVPVAIALVIVLVFALRGDDDEPAEPVVEPAQPAQPVPAAPQLTAQPGTEQAATPTAAPDPASVAADLDRALRRQRLWSTVEVSGGRIDVRSAACGDAAMTAVIDASVPSLRSVGLTQLRCLAQSGAVVLERGL